MTERANAESALAASEARARAMIEGAADAIFAFDKMGVISSANAASARIFGRPVEDLIGDEVCRLMPEPYRSEYASRLRERVEMGDEFNSRPSREIQGLRGDGAPFPMSLTISQVKYGQTRLFVGFARDLTEQRRIEARVRQFNDERLASLEAMAASLAHEVNQPLTAGATFLTVARKMLAAPPNEGSAKVGQLLDKASEQMVRAGKIITRAREFSRRGEPDKTFQGLHELIRDVGKTLSENKAQANFRLIFRLEADDDHVLVDKVQISQVLVNLVRNAVQATTAPGPREIVLATSREQDMIRSQRDRCGRRLVGAGAKISFRAFLHDEVRRHGRRPVDRARHHRGAFRKDMGGA